MLKARSLTSLTARSLVVAVVVGTAMFVGGVANADTDENSGISDPTPTIDTSPTDTSPIGGLLPGGTGGLGGLLGPILGPVLGPVLGGPAGGGTGDLNPGKLVSPILDPILGEVSDSTGLDLRQITGPILGGLGS